MLKAGEPDCSLLLPAGRECIYPEVNRNLNIGEKGVNMNSQVFRQYLTKMSFNQELVWAATWSCFACLLSSSGSNLTVSAYQGAEQASFGKQGLDRLCC